MSEIKVGKLIFNKAAQRDAIHIAVAPVVAGELLEPSERITIKDGIAFKSVDYIGIVDPFLPNCIPKGSTFYIWLTPNSVTGMRHHWKHPDFPDEDQLKKKQEAISWLKQAADQLGMSYEDLTNENCEIVNGDYITEYDSEDARDVWYELKKVGFWEYYELATGRDIPENLRGGFSCSC